eukprot:756155-Hanusia_phi.AAC.3
MPSACPSTNIPVSLLRASATPMHRQPPPHFGPPGKYMHPCPVMGRSFSSPSQYIPSSHLRLMLRHQSRALRVDVHLTRPSPSCSTLRHVDAKEHCTCSGTAASPAGIADVRSALTSVAIWAFIKSKQEDFHGWGGGGGENNEKPRSEAHERPHDQTTLQYNNCFTSQTTIHGVW